MCCTTPAYLRDPRTGKQINAATAVAIGQAVETSEGPAAAPDFIPNAIQTKAANKPNTKHTLDQLKTIAAGVGIGFVFCSIMR
jgi:hypothetical protein